MKRMWIILLSCCLLFTSLSSVRAYAEEDEAAEESDIDITEEQEKVSKLGIPTVSSVEELRKAADELWEDKDYEKAADAYAEYAEQANWLANLISSALEPYYSASYDDKKSFNLFKTDKGYSALAGESKSNSYKGERNRARLYEGLCYYYLEDYEKAVPRLIKALELIEIDDLENWMLGMDALYTILGL